VCCLTEAWTGPSRRRAHRLTPLLPLHTPSIIQDAYRLYPPSGGGHWRHRESHAVGYPAAKSLPQRREKKLPRSHHLPDRLRLRHGAGWLTRLAIDIILVGRSLAHAMLATRTRFGDGGRNAHHVRAVRRGVKDALLVADMPYVSYTKPPKRRPQRCPFVKRPASKR